MGMRMPQQLHTMGVGTEIDGLRPERAGDLLARQRPLPLLTFPSHKETGRRLPKARNFAGPTTNGLEVMEIQAKSVASRAHLHGNPKRTFFSEHSSSEALTQRPRLCDNGDRDLKSAELLSNVSACQGKGIQEYQFAQPVTCVPGFRPQNKERGRRAITGQNNKVEGPPMGSNRATQGSSEVTSSTANAPRAILSIVRKDAEQARPRKGPEEAVSVKLQRRRTRSTRRRPSTSPRFEPTQALSAAHLPVAEVREAATPRWLPARLGSSSSADRGRRACWRR